MFKNHCNHFFWFSSSEIIHLDYFLYKQTNLSTTFFFAHTFAVPCRKNKPLRPFSLTFSLNYKGIPFTVEKGRRFRSRSLNKQSKLKKVTGGEKGYEGRKGGRAREIKILEFGILKRFSGKLKTWNRIFACKIFRRIMLL